MAKNYVGPGNILDVAASGAAIASGDVVVQGALVGVALEDIADGSSGPVQFTGEFELAKEAALVITQGDKLYWKAATPEVTKTATGNTLMGHAAADAAGADATVVVRLQAAL